MRFELRGCGTAGWVEVVQVFDHPEFPTEARTVFRATDEGPALAVARALATYWTKLSGERVPVLVHEPARLRRVA